MRIEGESRTSTAVVDPAGGTYTEINEWGPAVRPEELETLLEKLRYLTQGAELVVFAGSLPRDVADDFYAEAVARARAPPRAGRARLPRASRCGSASRPSRSSSRRTRREAEALVGQEFHDDEDFLLALDRIAEMGARNVLITTEGGCVALLREEREARRFRAVAPRLEPVSTVGAGDVLLGGFLAARHAGRTNAEALRAAVAAGAASTLEVGAGRFDPRQAGRLQAGVERLRARARPTGVDPRPPAAGILPGWTPGNSPSTPSGARSRRSSRRKG